jgi:O-6-methylguanine DNA methyltransferase
LVPSNPIELATHSQPIGCVGDLRDDRSFRKETLLCGRLRLTLLLDEISGQLREVILPIEVPPRLTIESVREAATTLSSYRLRENVDPSAAAFAIALARIPEGETRTYGDLARLLGSSPRGIGSRCASNRLLLRIPCHRVVSSNGLGGYRSGFAWKRTLLQLEAGREAGR